MSFVFKLLVMQTTFFVQPVSTCIYRTKNTSLSLISEKKEDFDVPRINFAAAISWQIGEDVGRELTRIIYKTF